MGEMNFNTSATAFIQAKVPVCKSVICIMRKVSSHTCHIESYNKLTHVMELLLFLIGFTCENDGTVPDLHVHYSLTFNGFL